MKKWKLRYILKASKEILEDAKDKELLGEESKENRHNLSMDILSSSN